VSVLKLNLIQFYSNCCRKIADTGATGQHTKAWPLKIIFLCSHRVRRQQAQCNFIP